MKDRIVQLAAGIILLAVWGCAGEPANDNTYDPNNDRMSPAVLSISPGDGDVAVSVNASVVATLSEDIDTLSITSDNVVLLDGTCNIVAGVISYSDRMITFTPVEKMNHCQEYTVVLTDRIRDLAGHTLEEDYVTTFSTRISYEPQMVRVEGTPSGEPFLMGSSVIVGSSVPEHLVALSAFYIGKTEVTFDQFDEFCTATGREKPMSNFGRGFMPVINVSWYDAVDYCNWLSDVQGFPRCYYRDGPVVRWVDDDGGEMCTGYRLPTEAEWEYAAREGGVTSPSGYSGHWEGITVVDDYVWYSSNSDGVTHEAASRNPNQLGLFDMSGNVSEWCWDWYDASYYSFCFDNQPVENPHGAGANSDHRKIHRGGAWDSSEALYEIATGKRYHRSATHMSTTLGFRIAKSE